MAFAIFRVKQEKRQRASMKVTKEKSAEHRAALVETAARLQGKGQSKRVVDRFNSQPANNKPVRECSGGLMSMGVLWLQGSLWFRWCTLRTVRLAVVHYLVSAPIRTHGLGQPAHRAWSSVANADAPLAYELATAFAFGGHSVSLFGLAELPDNTHAQKVVALGRPGVVSASTREP